MEGICNRDMFPSEFNSLFIQRVIQYPVRPFTLPQYGFEKTFGWHFNLPEYPIKIRRLFSRLIYYQSLFFSYPNLTSKSPETSLNNFL